MFKDKSKYKLSFFLIPLTITIIYFGWKKWSLTTPRPLPQKSDVSVTQDDLILKGTYYQVFIPPTKNDVFLSAEYRLWIPDGVTKIRGLIVKQHGCGDDAAATGLNHANDLQWQVLALKHQFALLGTKFPDGNKNCGSWAYINNGSEKAFFKALKLFGHKSNHLEIEQVPWLLWGHSGGGDWVAQMLQQYPNRTIAAIAARGGGFNLFGTNPTLARTPLMFALGEQDKNIVPYETQTLPKQVFARYRKINSLWAIASEANTTHETSDTRLLAIPYFDAIATARMPQQGNKLLALNPAQGWLGNISTKEIVSVDDYQGNSTETAWLPNEETARKWQEYVTTGNIEPTVKPNAPNNVQARQINDREVLITWDFTPDLENGLPSFRIYRDNSLIQTLTGQKHNFGDAPDATNIVLEFRDREAKADSTYTVAAFNELGESVSSPATSTKTP
jgi:pimeloyl-ACP methyl ester carboxylesterase